MVNYDIMTHRCVWSTETRHISRAIFNLKQNYVDDNMFEVIFQFSHTLSSILLSIVSSENYFGQRQIARFFIWAREALSTRRGLSGLTAEIRAAWPFSSCHKFCLNCVPNSHLYIGKSLTISDYCVGAKARIDHRK